MNLNKVKKPILITGASGFIGSNLLRFFYNRKINVYGLVREKSNQWRIKDLKIRKNIFYVNLENKKKLNKIISKIKPKTIYHLATYGGSSEQKNYKKIENTIYKGTINLIEACKKYNFKLFINTGSSSEYGFKNKPMKETDSLKPNSTYSFFKGMTTSACKYYSNSENLPIVTVRPFHVYGPYESHTRLIPTLISSITKGKKISLVDPKISRDLIYIDDLIKFYIFLSNFKKQKYINGKVYNLGYGRRITIKMIFETLKKVSKSKTKPKWNTMKNRSWDQKIWVADMSHVRKILKWSPKINYIKGLKNSYYFFKKFYEN